MTWPARLFLIGLVALLAVPIAILFDLDWPAAKEAPAGEEEPVVVFFSATAPFLGSDREGL